MQAPSLDEKSSKNPIANQYHIHIHKPGSNSIEDSLQVANKPFSDQILKDFIKSMESPSQKEIIDEIENIDILPKNMVDDGIEVDQPPITIKEAEKVIGDTSILGGVSSMLGGVSKLPAIQNIMESIN